MANDDRSFPNRFFATDVTPQETATHSRWILNFMTTAAPAALFTEMISKLGPRGLQRIAAQLTSDPGLYMEIARNINGSRRLQMLFGKSDDVDAFFSTLTMPQAEIPAIAPPPSGIPAAISRNQINSFSNRFFATDVTFQETATHSRWMLDFMTTAPAALFTQMISKLGPRGFQRLAAQLTSDSDRFMYIARNNDGSRRLQILFGKSDDVDALFSTTISTLFFPLMIDNQASHVATRALRVFAGRNKESVFQATLLHALAILRCQEGCYALKRIIIELDNPYKGRLLAFLTSHALSLSVDPYGSFLIIELLKLDDLFYTYNTAISLRGHCVELSFNRYGVRVVEAIVEAGQSLVVVEDFAGCNVERLVELATSGHGHYVVARALILAYTRRGIRADLFSRLVDKLRPFLQLLRDSGKINIVSILELA